MPWVHLVVTRPQDQAHIPWCQSLLFSEHGDVSRPAPQHGIIYDLFYFYCMVISFFLFSQIKSALKSKLLFGQMYAVTPALLIVMCFRDYGVNGACSWDYNGVFWLSNNSTQAGGRKPWTRPTLPSERTSKPWKATNTCAVMGAAHWTLRPLCPTVAKHFFCRQKVRGGLGLNSSPMRPVAAEWHMTEWVNHLCNALYRSYY